MNGVARASDRDVGAFPGVSPNNNHPRRLDHPLGISNDYITSADVSPRRMTRIDYLSCLLQNCTLRSFNGVVEGTKEQYRPGWKEYLAFMHSVLQADPFLHTPFDEWSRFRMATSGIPYPVVVIRAFMEHLQFKRSYSGPLINSYLSAVRFNLLHSGVPVDFFTHPLVRSARAATEREWRVAHPESDSPGLGRVLPPPCSACSRGPGAL